MVQGHALHKWAWKLTHGTHILDWMVEGGSPNSLIRVGVTKYTLQIGMELTIEAYQAKDASNTAVGRKVSTENTPSRDSQDDRHCEKARHALSGRPR